MTSTPDPAARAPNVFVDFQRLSLGPCGCRGEWKHPKPDSVDVHPPHDKREATYHYGCSRCGEYWTEEVDR